eukprot:164012-Pyramimonas_sp.AAC.1
MKTSSGLRVSGGAPPRSPFIVFGGASGGADTHDSRIRKIGLATACLFSPPRERGRASALETLRA